MNQLVILKYMFIYLKDNFQVASLSNSQFFPVQFCRFACFIIVQFDFLLFFFL